MDEPPIFGENGAVLNSGTIPPDKIRLYDGSEKPDHAHAAPYEGLAAPYEGLGKFYSWFAGFLLLLALIPSALIKELVVPEIALGLVIASIGFSALALKYISNADKFPTLKRHVLIDLTLLVPLSYALLNREIPVQTCILGFIFAALGSRFVLWGLTKLFPSPRTPQ